VFETLYFEWHILNANKIDIVMYFCKEVYHFLLTSLEFACQKFYTKVTSFFEHSNLY